MANMCFLNIHTHNFDIVKALKDRAIKEGVYTQASNVFRIATDKWIFDMQQTYGADGSICYGTVKWMLNIPEVVELIRDFNLKSLEISYEESSEFYGVYTYTDGILYDKYIPNNNDIFSVIEADGDDFDAVLDEQDKRIAFCIDYTEIKDKLIQIYPYNDIAISVAQMQVTQGWVPPEHLRNLKINEETLWEMYTQIALGKL